MPRSRVDNQRSFVLHSYHYSETSLIVEVFARDIGRLALLARGARRPRSALRGVLLAFQPLSLAWSGKGEVRTLQRAEWLGGLPRLSGEALLCGFYLSELLIKMLARDDPHEQLFDDYAQALSWLSTGVRSAPTLRWFEKRLLKELGYAMVLDREAVSGAPINAQAHYTYDPERGPILLDPKELWTSTTRQLVVPGNALAAIARDDYADSNTLLQAKLLMRHLINHRLDRRPLLTRRVFADLQQL